MARLPAPEDIQRARMPANTPGVSLKTPDYGPVVTAGKAMAEGLSRLGSGFDAVVSMNDQVDDYETKKKLLDFQLNAEMALEERKRSMPVGAQGYADGWQSDFKGMASEFVGKNDANIPASQRLKVGLALKRIDTQLAERAQRDQFAEQDRFELDGLVDMGKRLQDKVLAEPERLEEMRKNGIDLINQSRLTPAARHKALQKYETDVEEAYFTGLRGRIKSKADLDAFKESVGVDLPDKFQGPGKPTKSEGLEQSKPRNPFDLSGRNGPQSSYKPGDNVFGSKHATGLYPNAANAIADDAAYMSRPRAEAAIKNIIYHWDSVPDPIRTIKYGQKVDSNRGFDPGYHFYIDRDGNVLQGAPLDRVTNHIKNGTNGTTNANAIGIVMAGVSDNTPPTEAQLQKAVELGGELQKIYKVPSTNIYGHGEVNPGHRSKEEGMAAVVPLRSGASLQQTGGAMDADPNAPAYEGPGRTLGLSRRMAHWNAAQADWQKHVVGMGKEIENFEKVAGDGYNLPDGVLGDLQKRVEASGDQTLQSRFRATLGLAAESQRLQQMPPPLLEQYTQNLRRSAGEKGITAEQQKYIEHAEKVSATVRKNTSEDPLSWAQRTGIKLPIVAGQGPDGFSEPVKLEQMNFGSKDIDAVLTRRMEQAKIVGSYYAQEPQAFTKIERDALKSTLKQGGDAMLYVMGKIAKSAGEAGIPPEQVMKEFTKDAPEVAMIGDLVANNADRNLLDTAAKALSYRASQKENFKSYVDRSQARPNEGDYMKVLNNMRPQIDAVRSLADLIYTYEAPGKGIAPDNFNNAHYQNVIGRLLGKVETPDGLSYGGIGKQDTGGWFSSPILVPPGVRSDRFDEMKSAFRTSDFAFTGKPVDADGKPYTAAEIRQMEWQAVGPGQYVLVEQTKPDGTKVLAGSGGRTKDGKPAPFVLDVRQMMPQLKRRVPDIVLGYDGRTAGIDDDPPKSKSPWPGGSFGEIEVPSNLR